MPALPESFAFTLRGLRFWCGFNSIREFSMAIDQTDARTYKNKKGATISGSLKGGIYEGIEKRWWSVPYHRLERYADLSGIPTGVQQIISHTLSRLRDEKYKDAERFANGLEVLAVAIRHHAKSETKCNTEEQQLAYVAELFNAWHSFGLRVDRREKGSVLPLPLIGDNKDRRWTDPKQSKKPH